MIVAILFNGLLQGAAVFAIANLAVRCVSERNATTRHALWFASLLALFLVPILTAVSNVGARLADALRPSVDGHRMAVSLLPIGAIAQNVTHLAAPLTAWIVAAWLTGVAFQISRLIGSFVRIERVRQNAGLVDVSGERVLVSTDLAMPISAGFLEPVIIIPKSVIEALAPIDLARVIAHERAHISRNDILSNLVQRWIEAILFFNPWALVIGRNLVDERESACDDLAVLSTGAASDYAKCLALLAKGHQEQRPLLSPSVLGSRNAVVARIERLIRNGDHGATSLNYYSIGGTVVVFAILTLALQALSPVSAAPTYASSFLSSGSTSVAVVCTKPNVDAKIEKAVQPDVPESAPDLNGFVNVLVTIAPSGEVFKATIAHSSGNQPVDEAVLDAAKSSTYSPARRSCAAVAGTYVFHAEFTPRT